MNTPECPRGWIRALKGTEGLAGTELPGLGERIPALEADEAARSTGGKRETP